MHIINIADDINRSWLRQVSIDIKKGKLTMKEAAEHAQFYSMMGNFEKSISVKTLHKLFISNGITTFQVGRKGRASEISLEASNFIKTNCNDLKIGIRKMYELCVDKQIHVSRRMVEDFYKTNFPVKSKPKENENSTKYECQEVNSAWHGDIHYLQASDDIPEQAY